MSYAGTVISVSASGDRFWIDPGNAEGDTAGTAATVNPPSGSTSELLRATNFGFAIPSGATILGITAEIEAVCTVANRHRWTDAYLVLAGAESGSNLGDLSYIPDAVAFKTFGSSSDLWGLSLTDTDINDAGFGVSVKLERPGSSAVTSVSRIRITVDYLFGVSPVTADAVWTFSGTANLTANGVMSADATLTWAASAVIPQATNNAAFFLGMCDPVP